jgi:hypothetical protein
VLLCAVRLRRPAGCRREADAKRPAEHTGARARVRAFGPLLRLTLSVLAQAKAVWMPAQPSVMTFVLSCALAAGAGVIDGLMTGDVTFKPEHCFPFNLTLATRTVVGNVTASPA